MTVSARSLGILALIATAALWGSNHVVARAARDAAPLPALVLWRWLPAVIILSAVGWPALRRNWPQIRQHIGALSIGGAVGVGVFSYLLIGGAYHSLALEVGIINATTPMWVVVLSLTMKRERPDAATGFGLLLAFAGTLLIFCKGDLSLLSAVSFNLGNLLSLLAAMAFAWFSIQVRDWSRIIEALPLTVVTAWAGVLIVLIPVYVVWIATGGPWLAWTDADIPVALGAIAYTGIGPTMLGNVFYLYGVSTNGPTRAAAFLYLSPICSAAFSIVFLGEKLHWYHLTGIAAIFLGLALLGRPMFGASNERAARTDTGDRSSW